MKGFLKRFTWVMLFAPFAFACSIFGIFMIFWWLISGKDLRDNILIENISDWYWNLVFKP